MRYGVWGRMVRGSSPGSGKPRNYAKGFLQSRVRGSIQGTRKIPQYLCPRKLKLWQELYSLAAESYFQHIFESGHGLFRQDRGRAEVIFLNDLRWGPKLIAWANLLQALEGDVVHLPAPKTFCQRDLEKNPAGTTTTVFSMRTLLCSFHLDKCKQWHPVTSTFLWLHSLSSQQKKETLLSMFRKYN